MEKKPEENKKQKRETRRWTPEVEAVANGRGENCRQESGGGKSNERTAKLVPLDKIPEARKMLISVLDSPPAEVHRMVTAIRHGWPGRKPGEILDTIRRLRDDRGEARGTHAVWTEEDIDILRAGYAEGPAGASRSRKELLRRHPDWNRRVLDWKAAELKITRPRALILPWTQKQRGQVILWSQEITVRQLAARVEHSERGVRTRLSLNGVRGKVRATESYSVREAAALLGVSHTSVWKWLMAGLLGENRRCGRPLRLSEAVLREFCKQYPEKVNVAKGSPEAREWMGNRKSDSARDPARAHLTRLRSCLQCGRSISGNGFYTHLKACVGYVQSSISNV